MNQKLIIDNMNKWELTYGTRIAYLEEQVERYEKTLKYIKANSNKNDFYTAFIYDLVVEALDK
jgi:hypothetical protein